MLARSSGQSFNSILPIVGLDWIPQLCQSNIFETKEMIIMKEQRLFAWDNWFKNAVVCHKKHYIFRALTVSFHHFLHAFWCKQKLWWYHERCSSLWLKLIKNKDQYYQPFSQVRNIGDKAITFYPGYKAAYIILSSEKPCFSS